MKLTKQSFEILEQEIPIRKLDDSIESYKNRYLEYMYKHIEKCGRTCYKSEDKITEDSATRFVNGLIKSKHYSVLEHGVVYLQVPNEQPGVIMRYIYNPYAKMSNDWGCHYITTNYRVIVENGWEDDLQYLSEPTEYHEKRHTVLLHSCIHVYKDLTRHRRMSFSIESTRYCNYSKTDKFGEMKFVLPPWVNPTAMNIGSGNDYISKEMYMDYLKRVEDDYNHLIKLGWQAQQAAEILPQCTAADVVMSGCASDWEFVFKLRTSYIHATGMPHPLVSEIIDPVYKEFIKRSYINENI